MSISGCTSCRSGQTQAAITHQRVAQAPRLAEAQILEPALQLGVNQSLPGQSAGSIPDFNA